MTELIATKKTRREIRIQRKRDILAFVKAFHEKNGICPSLKEIAVSVTGKPEDEGNISVWVKQLIKENYLKRAASGGRSLVLIDPPPKEVYDED